MVRVEMQACRSSNAYWSYFLHSFSQCHYILQLGNISLSSFSGSRARQTRPRLVTSTWEIKWKHKLVPQQSLEMLWRHGVWSTKVRTSLSTVHLARNHSMESSYSHTVLVAWGGFGYGGVWLRWSFPNHRKNHEKIFLQNVTVESGREREAQCARFSLPFPLHSVSMMER